MELWKLFEYQVWADEKVFYFLTPLNEKERSKQIGEYTSIKNRMAHIVMTLDVWYERLQGSSPTTLPNYLELTTTELIEEWRELNTKLQTFFSEPHGSKFTYTNSEGIEFENSHEDVAMHLINHTTFYRSQIIMMIRILGYEVADTDYIHYAR